jgi:hypothetical protein
MTDLKTSLLVNRQVPEFVRDEYPKFISFLEAYYEFLETKQGTEKNDLIKVSKDLRYLSDVDYSLNQFEDQFFNTFVSYFPKDVAVTKEFLIKNVLPLYLSKGSESSFKFLFRLLFGEEVTVRYPKDNILRASDGKWLIENILRITNTIETFYIADGITNEFKLSQEVTKEDIKVYVNGNLQTNGFFVKKELKKIVFDIIPNLNDEISVEYNLFNSNLLINRQITGLSSGTKCLIEKTNLRSVSGDNYFEFFVNSKTLNGSFQNGEIVVGTIIDSDNNTINFRCRLLSDLLSIDVIDGGASYNVGDPVIIRGPSTRQASAVVEEVASGAIEKIVILDGGSGFKVGNIVEATDIPLSVFTAEVQTVDTRGINTPNTVSFFTDLITDIDSETTLDSLDYGFLVIANANSNTIISEALETITLNSIGPATSIIVTNSSLLSQENFNIIPETVKGTVKLNDLGIIGKIDIIDGGENYEIGDQLIFTNQPEDWTGIGAAAEVSGVSENGSIESIKIIDGGLGYNQLNLPIISVDPLSNGSNAILEINSILGTGEELIGEFVGGLPGEIRKIKILDAGEGYETIPAIDLSNFGNGLATASALLRDSFITLPGKWTTTDSILSSDDRRLQGRDYYINFSYVLSSKVEFAKYKNIFRKLIHPSGFIEYGELLIEEELNKTQSNVQFVNTTTSISGLVSTNSSIYVIGTNTYFEISNTLNILVPGSNVAISSEIRTVDEILSNTQFTVTEPFTIDVENETLTILT